MQQYMTGLLPMSQPQGGGGIGGMAQTALSMFMDKRKQDAQDAKMQAYISALRGGGLTDPGDIAAHQGALNSALDNAYMSSRIMPTQPMPPMMGFD